MGKEVQELYPWEVRGWASDDVVWLSQLQGLFSVRRMHLLGARRNILIYLL